MSYLESQKLQTSQKSRRHTENLPSSGTPTRIQTIKMQLLKFSRKLEKLTLYSPIRKRDPFTTSMANRGLTRLEAVAVNDLTSTTSEGSEEWGQAWGEVETSHLLTLINFSDRHLGGETRLPSSSEMMTTSSGVDSASEGGARVKRVVVSAKTSLE